MVPDVRAVLKEEISRYVGQYCLDGGIESIWGEPLVGFADAHDPGFDMLKILVQDSHHLPGDILPGATIVVSYYLPFKESLARENIEGESPSDSWGRAYMETNLLSVGLGEHLASVVRSMGFPAESPKDVRRTEGTIVSRWSQRHIARMAGLGTFGMNNMLITDSGCCGRFYSIVTGLDVEPDPPVQGENCPFKNDGSCGACMRRCVSGALTPDGFDRHVCDGVGVGNSARFGGVSVCGKCIVGMPCSFRNPCRRV